MADSNDTSPFNPGDQFGDYTVERLLGRGSMGSVYLMRSPDGSPFAVKIMHRGMMSPDMRVRFVREAESMMDVRHRNLVSVYDAGEDPDTGLCYIIMDYMPGGTLADMIKARGRIPVGDAVKIAMHIAAALDVVHRSGLVHRDVKPDNIMFAADGTPKLADLGVAKFGDERNTMVTMTGMVIGTPAYMAPEQLMDSHKIDARADIYSLGVILYEMLSGKRPNSGSTSVELLAKAIKGEPLPDIRTMQPETSAAVAHVLSLMCAPKPDDRPETAVAAAQILRKAATGKFFVLPKKRPDASAVRKAEHRILPIAGMVGAVLLVASAIFGWLTHTARRATMPVAAGTTDGKLIEVFPRLDRSPTAWAYSFEREQGWETPGFDDSKWKRSQGGFGSRQAMHQLPGAHINTTWDSERIFLRRRFNWSGGDVSRVVVDVYHDDDVTIHLNGEFMLAINRANFEWQPFEIPVERFAKAIRNVDNVFCVEVRNASQYQYFDCGLLFERGGKVNSRAVKDGTRKVATDVGTWTVVIKDGIAQIGDGLNIALDPQPRGRLTIPSELDGLQIRNLAQDCFRRCNDLESVVVSEGIRSMGQGAFSRCERLSAIVVPESLEHIGPWSFSSTKITHIDLKNVRLMGSGAFERCYNLEKAVVSAGNPTYYNVGGVVYDSIRRAVVFCPRSRTSYTFPEGIKEVDGWAFQSCKIKNLVIPDTVKIVGNSAFSECPLLESVEFKGDDVILGDWSFGNNPALKSVVLPRGQKSLDASAIFRTAGQLESIVLPDTVDTIGAGVFEGCKRLKNVHFGKSLRRGNFRAFAGCAQLEEIHFPKSLEKLGPETFLNCKSLRRVIFDGNAPSFSNAREHFGRDIYKGVNKSLVTIVPVGSTGWFNKSDRLPERWPKDGGENARAIAHSDSVSATVRQPTVSEAWRPGPSPDWFVEWDKALAEAKKTGKKLFVLKTGSDWCGWCKKLKADVLDKPKFNEFAKKNLVLLYLDNPHQNPLCEGQKAHNQHVSQALEFSGGVPNVQIFSAGGIKLGRIGGGGLAADAYIDRVKRIVAEKGEPVHGDEGKKLFNDGYGTKKVGGGQEPASPGVKATNSRLAVNNAEIGKTVSAKQIVLVPRLDRDPKAWVYSFDEERGWNNLDFDDSKWKRAPGGFGQRESARQLPRAIINTTWDSKRIFLRRRFNWYGGDVSRVVVDVYHDDDVTIYLNGEFMLAINGANFDWLPFEMPVERFGKALRKGENVLCVEVRDFGHCQYFDGGLVVECGGTPSIYAGADCVRKIKTAVGTWTVVVRDGVAQIGDGRHVALDPRPKGILKIPSELDGLQIRKLARDCFIRCEELESVIVPEGINSIDEGAFLDCGRLSSVLIPSTLEHLGHKAFHGTNLNRIDIKNVRLMAGSVFMRCKKLEKIDVAAGNLTFAVKDGVLYDKIRKAVVVCPHSRKSYAFPDGIEEIYDSAFQSSRVKSIVIPETVRLVGHCAFNECPFLESVKFKGPDAVIFSWAFGNTPSLKSVVLPDRLKDLDDWSIFNHAGQLESIVLPDTVESISDAVFENCPKLKHILLGKSIKRIGHHAFAGCKQLKSIEFPATLRELGAEVLQDCSSLTTVSFLGDAPDMQDQGNERFGDDIFRGANPSLVTIVPKGAMGWTDSSGKLPKVWPEAAGEFARAIRFANGRRTGGARK